MDATWRFERKLKSQKSRDPMQASFFTNASIEDDTHALVREAIQNSLDAKLDISSKDPVKARFHIGCNKAETNVMDQYITEDAWKHFNSPDNGLKSPPASTDDCKYLVYEDFNTSGLVGDERAYEAQKNNSFYYFMRAEGQSGKEDGERGRHGIGKYVFPYTSRIRMFISATVRSTDKRVLIAGQSVLKAHRVPGEEAHYTPDGWWGQFEGEEGDYFQLPVESLDVFESLKKDFELTRTTEDTGLSLVLPYIQNDVSVELISKHVIKEYFWPILSGDLIVEVSNGRENILIDSNALSNELDGLLFETDVKRISPYVNLAVKVIHGLDLPIIELNRLEKPAMPKWDKNLFNSEHASILRQELEKENGLAQVRCPLYVKPEDGGKYEESYFDMYLLKESTDESRKPLFIREGISIPEDRVQSVRGYTCIVVIEAGMLATLLGDSENPAHTEWEKNASKFKGKYKWGAKTIDFVRNSVSKLLNLMSQGDEEEDFSVLSDIFYLNIPENDEDVPAQRKKKKKIIKPVIDDPNIPSPPVSRVKNFQLIKSEGGFIIKGPEQPLQTKRHYKVAFAYYFDGASRATALKRHHKNDFNLKNTKNIDQPIAIGVNDLVLGENSFEFTADSNDFSLEIRGLDKNRDIVIDPRSMEVTSEKV
jgi:hypothetical protein